MSHSDDPMEQHVKEALRNVRNRARSDSSPEGRLPTTQEGGSDPGRLPSLPETTAPEVLVSPDREKLNAVWNVTRAFETVPGGRLGRWLAPLRRPLRRVIRFAFGPVVDRQVEMNAAQVQFDNELVSYVDTRMDRLSAHYDHVLGLHGKRMEEIDERHLILQQELVQHVHDLVKRIDFVFETAEQNHLYLEGFLREQREELEKLAKKIDPATPGRFSEDES